MPCVCAVGNGRQVLQRAGTAQIVIQQVTADIQPDLPLLRTRPDLLPQGPCGGSGRRAFTVLRGERISNHPRAANRVGRAPLNHRRLIDIANDSPDSLNQGSDCLVLLHHFVLRRAGCTGASRLRLFQSLLPGGVLGGQVGDLRFNVRYGFLRRLLSSKVNEAADGVSRAM